MTIWVGIIYLFSCLICSYLRYFEMSLIQGDSIRKWDQRFKNLFMKSCAGFVFIHGFLFYLTVTFLN